MTNEDAKMENSVYWMKVAVVMRRRNMMDIILIHRI